MICNKSSDSDEYEQYNNTQSEFTSQFKYDEDEDSSELSKDDNDNMSEYSNYAIKDIKADFEWIDNEFEALAFDSLELNDE